MMTKKGFCVGQLVVDEKLQAKMYVYIFKEIVFTQEQVSYKYVLRVSFSKPLKFLEVQHLLSNFYSTKNYFDWEMGLLRDQIMPELNRLKSVGFQIDEIGVSNVMSELV